MEKEEMESTTMLNGKPLSATPRSPILPWSDMVLSKVTRFAPQQTPSHIYLWYHAEKAKREDGLENEIDLNEIRAAAKGVINGWFCRVSRDPKKFQCIVDGLKFDWKDIVEITNT